MDFLLSEDWSLTERWLEGTLWRQSALRCVYVGNCNGRGNFHRLSKCIWRNCAVYCHPKFQGHFSEHTHFLLPVFLNRSTVLQGRGWDVWYMLVVTNCRVQWLQLCFEHPTRGTEKCAYYFSYFHLSTDLVVGVSLPVSSCVHLQFYL